MDDTISQRYQTALRPLVDDAVISDAQAQAVLAALRRADAEQASRGGWWVEALGYIGGSLLLAGAITLVGVSWDDLTRAGRVGLLSLIALGLIGAGLLIGGGFGATLRLNREGPAVRRRITGVLLALAAAVGAIALAVAVDNRPDPLGPAFGLALAIGAYGLVRTVFGLLTAAVLSLITVVLLADDVRGSVLIMTFALIALGVAWMVATFTARVQPTEVGLGVGATIGLIGAQQPLFDGANPTWAYALTVGFAVACLALYRARRAIVLLLAGVAGITIAVPEAVWDYTDGAGGAAAILIVTGAVLLAASGAALRLRARRSIAPPAMPASPQ
jgi:hypothetical protein